MIKFFRKIRQKLLSKNKVSSYVLYAVGEIVLVVIGILIALAINDWNEKRKGLLTKNTLLRAIEIEFTQNLEQLDTVLKYDNLVVQSSFEFLQIRPDDSVADSTAYLRQLLQNTSWTWTFDPQNGALQSGISSGEINLISDEILTNMLFSWKDLVADAREDELRALNTRMEAKSVIEKHVRNVDYRSTDRTELGSSKFTSDYMGLMLDPLFEDYISDRYSRTLDAVNELNSVRATNLKILELVREELSSEN
ncbi:DUF6090 family protein [Algoriphagus namhaensis]|uniref:DUF6090 family protein n=1 Tax=Algoriphagus namhaensis TaxID=915353 RepID=A0ABV8APX5_9BACT